MGPTLDYRTWTSRVSNIMALGRFDFGIKAIICSLEGRLT